MPRGMRMTDARIKATSHSKPSTGMLAQVLAVAAMLVIAALVLYGR